jgi:hypothetical protein
MSVGIDEPVPSQLRALLRRAVLDLAERERRRVFPPALHVGVPGGTLATFDQADGEPLDLTLRVDVVEAMIRSLGRTPAPPLVWLSRPGPLDTQDVDLCWLAASAAAAAELDLELRMVVVDRHGWRDPRTGVGHRWTHLRRVRRPD